MALKFALPFPIFFPPSLNPNPNPKPNPTFFPRRHLNPSELRFSRWGNANAEEFEHRRRAQEEIESDIRRERRFSSVDRISHISTSSTTTTAAAGTTSTVKSTGTPSSPSSPSIPGRRSKYSVSPFKSISRVKKTQKKNLVVPKTDPIDKKAELKLSEDGVSYVIEGAPFEFMYSYTETPKVKPLKLREAPYAPFGPTTMPRPWTGRAPLPPSKKKLKEFDSFKLPPPGKKGVKPVQAPGPYLPGTGPRYVRSREEILGEPLTPEEVKDLVNGCIKSRRQMNMGRDGLTHNMLDNIHAHWKRRRVCKIKCKGVCTVDMDNVKKQLEERTGGKIIHSRGGVIFLFRGRNYNYRTRPRFPLMLWKPASPVYPRLIQRVPEGLTLEEAIEMRKKGRTLMPICKLAKNGVYCNLVANVREAFEECELVRINCQGLNPSDYKRIGGKLKDLVPCVLISFENEHILMWRGRDWKSSLPEADKPNEEVNTFTIDDVVTSAPSSQGLEGSLSMSLDKDVNHEAFAENVSPIIPESADLEESEHIDSGNIVNGAVDVNVDLEKTVENEDKGRGIENIELEDAMSIDVPVAVSDTSGSAVDNHEVENANSMVSITSDASELVTIEGSDKMLDTVEVLKDQSEVESLPSPCTEGVLLLLKQAVENGSAHVLDSSLLDADIVYQQAVAFAKTAPPGPIFRCRPRKIAQRKVEKEEDGNLDVKEAAQAFENKKNEKKNPKIQKKKDLDEQGYLNVAPHGSLRVDELAKLLA